MSKNLVAAATKLGCSPKAIAAAAKVPPDKEGDWLELSPRGLNAGLEALAAPPPAAPVPPPAATPPPATAPQAAQPGNAGGPAAVAAPAQPASAQVATPAARPATTQAAQPAQGQAKQPTKQQGWFAPPKMDMSGVNVGPAVSLGLLAIVIVIVGAILLTILPALPEFMAVQLRNFGKGQLIPIGTIGFSAGGWNDAKILQGIVVLMYVLGRIFEPVMRGLPRNQAGVEFLTDTVSVFAMAFIPAVLLANVPLAVNVTVQGVTIPLNGAWVVLGLAGAWVLACVVRGVTDLTPAAAWPGDVVLIAVTTGSLGLFAAAVGLPTTGVVTTVGAAIEQLKIGDVNGAFSLAVTVLCLVCLFIETMELFTRRDYGSMAVAWLTIGSYYLWRIGFSASPYVAFGASGIVLVVGMMYVATLIPVRQNIMEKANWRVPMYIFASRYYVPDFSDLIIYVSVFFTFLAMAIGAA